MKICHIFNSHDLWARTGAGGGGHLVFFFQFDVFKVSVMRMYDFLRYQEYKLDA